MRPITFLLATAALLSAPLVAALSFSGQSTYECREAAGFQVNMCARTTATITWVADSYCGLPPQPSPRDAYCLDVRHTGTGNGVAGGSAWIYSDTGYGYRCYWEAPQTSCTKDFGHHYAVHRKSREPTGCHTVTSTVTPSGDVFGSQGTLQSSAKACWNLN